MKTHMSEKEWLICARPDLMLLHLQRQFGFRTLRRKIRLFICACRRLGWELATTPDERSAVEAAERFADGQATHVERDAARWKLRFDQPRSRSIRLDCFQGRPLTNMPQMIAFFACEADNRLGDAAFRTAACLVQAWTEAALGPNAHQRPGSEWGRYVAMHRRSVCYFLRDIFGNPFRTISIDSLWVEWNDGIVLKLAQALYDEYAFDRLPILADALEEAECTDADILDHCRRPGEHVRGCWVIDLILGRS